MESRTSAGELSRADRIRRLGFDPAHLTAEEQEELLELHGERSFVDRVASASEAGESTRRVARRSAP